ncbi:MAG TPA: hypothetical protein DCQ83_00685 [Fibrobacteres bacterium]|nr:hypothetical protein [Fibrobacterota bacterium]
MGLFLSKLIPALLSPVSLVCLFCLAAGIRALIRRAILVAVLTLLAALILYTSASPIVSRALICGLEKQYPEPESYEKASAVVLLGGAMIAPALPRRHPELNECGDRLLQAARLWQQGLAPVVVTTGGSVPFLTGQSEDDASMYARVLSELFAVPDSAILRVSRSQNTYEDALYTMQLFEKRGMKKDILLVTSATHMPRAAQLFRKQGFIVHPAPTDFRAGEKPLTQPFRFFPVEWALNETVNALHEYMGLAAYKLMGRL